MDAVSAIATNPTGNTNVIGDHQPAGPIFVSKLDPSGKILFTTTFGGKGLDRGTAIAVDPSGNIYVAGTTTSSDFPSNHPLQKQIFPIATINGVPAGTGFITKLSSDGATILYSTFFGGT